MAPQDPRDLEILKVLWEEGPLKPAEIEERLSFPIKNSALRWQLASLMEEGHVARRKKGKAFYYRARIPRQSAFKKIMGRMAETFCGGSAVALIGRMIESQEDLSEEDVRELQRIAARKAQSADESTEE